MADVLFASSFRRLSFDTEIPFSHTHPGIG